MIMLVNHRLSCGGPDQMGTSSGAACQKSQQIDAEMNVPGLIVQWTIGLTDMELGLIVNPTAVGPSARFAIAGTVKSVTRGASASGIFSISATAQPSVVQEVFTLVILRSRITVLPAIDARFIIV